MTRAHLFVSSADKVSLEQDQPGIPPSLYLGDNATVTMHDKHLHSLWKQIGTYLESKPEYDGVLKQPRDVTVELVVAGAGTVLRPAPAQGGRRG